MGDGAPFRSIKCCAFFLGDYISNPSAQYLPSKATAIISVT